MVEHVRDMYRPLSQSIPSTEKEEICRPEGLGRQALGCVYEAPGSRLLNSVRCLL